MALPVPNLDDRRFQDLVDDAKRLVQQRCPEWSDHNVSDPGVTLIELFAWMTDQLIYRVNRIPDRLYVKFLDLIGVPLFPPTSARAPVTFWLAAPQPDVVRIPVGTSVATVRTETDDAIAFSTIKELAIIPSSLERIGSTIDGETVRDHQEALAKGSGFFCFDRIPKPDDALLVGMPEATPSCAVTLRFRCEKIEGVGVDPRDPPLAWEALEGDQWVPCELDSDSTGGLNRDGDVVLHVPSSHVSSNIGTRKAGWLRARVIPPKPDQPTYGASPNITALIVFTVGGTVDAVNAELVETEDLAASEGVAGQRFALAHHPVVPGDEPPVLEVAADAGWDEWQMVAQFAESGPDDRHFLLDPVAGEVQLGPGVRQPDGSFRQYGAVPAKGARLRLRGYRTGGGSAGNVAQGALSVLKSSIPYITRVVNRRPARGGVDVEDIENAKIRGPIRLRTRDRAVTAEDYEHIAREAAPEVARARALTAGGGAEAGSVRLLIVPAAVAEGGQLMREQLVPSDETLTAISKRLDETRVVGTRVVVEPPLYQGVAVRAHLRARPRANPARLQEAAVNALDAYLDPISGGPDRIGWPFGRPVNVGELYAVLQGVRGTEQVESVELFGVDLESGTRGTATERLEIHPEALVLSSGHEVEVDSA
jgi:predicted phage baseplate assembly protein